MSSSYSLTWLVLLSSILAVAIFALLRTIRDFNRHPLPPGPRGLPLIGNAFDIPAERTWLKFTAWGKAFGDVVYISAFGKPMIILNSEKAVVDLLEKRSAIYSDRPFLPMVGELIGYVDSVPLIPYGPRHREYRKLMSTILSPRKAEELHSIQEQKTKEFLNSCLRSPDQFLPHIRHSVASIVFQITHGYTVAEENDPLVELAERVNKEFGSAAAPGAFLVDVFPVLRYLPDWFPGAGFKLKAKQMRQTMVEIRDGPYEYVKQQIANGTSVPSFTAQLIEANVNPTEEQEHINKWVSATFYGAGADTTTAAISTFFLAMTAYPEVQRKAQAELDKIVGPKRLPGFKDRANLPYIEALVKEVHRWIPVGPIAVPHRLIQDDVYEGYYIPSGSTIFPNNWAILRNPARYPSPSEFNPDRYIAKSIGDNADMNPDPRPYAFGYGRRVCPGQYLADNTLFVTVVMTLSVFNIGKVMDKNGQSIEPEIGTTTTTACHPLPFKCSITPRSPEAEALIRTSRGPK